MTGRPRTIQIFLPDGDPRGIRVAELTTSIVRVLEVPRKMLNQYLTMPEAKQVGLYLLVGDDHDADYPSVYIGQTGATGQRLVEHNKAKDFWNRALVVVSLTNSLTQTHSLYLEWLSIKQVQFAGRYLAENGNAGSKPHTPPSLEADCQDIFDTLRTLVATLGQPLFEPLAKAKDEIAKDDLFYCKSANYDAVGQYTVEGMVVLKGSKARKDMAPSLAKGSFSKKREGLIIDGALKLEEDCYVFQRDVLFKSPSGASDAITGASTNGWALWKTKDAKTLDELRRPKVMLDASSV